MSASPAAAAPSREPALLLALAISALVVSGIGPTERGTWWLEVFPVLVGIPLLVATRRRFPFTPLAYSLMFVFCVVLFTGGHYTYAAVPLGEWMKGWFGFERNHFDRVGHFLQGVIPAMVYRELLLRKSALRPGTRVFFLCCAMALSVSALYEIFEWRYAVMFGGDAATDFLGSQGDPWDAQQDMTMALLGGVLSQLLLARLHDAQIRRVVEPASDDD